ncbi:small ribosomal subunit protein eS10-like isoform X1 [Sycon ciliatum]|uniref:40S ribosomal protein s10 n=1 Tax=Sycon ciliatum TaxID=27933 RepID=M1XMR1_9METZ|nr:40S ribosomal protein s10 [Sycon ciliatum]
MFSLSFCFSRGHHSCLCASATSFPSSLSLRPTAKMLIPKKNRVAIYEHLFREGVMVAHKDFNAPKHPELEALPNLQVIKAMQSLKSRGYVNETYNWRHYYWYLNNEGINYLREYLHLPVEIVPTTLRRAARPEGQRPRPKGFGGAPSGRPEDDRSTYRRADGFGGAEGKPAGAGSDFRPEFRGGFGRGAPRGGGRGGFGGAQ